MKAIVSKRVPPTNTRPARWKVWAEGVRPRYYPVGMPGEDAEAALQFALELNWIKPDDFETLLIPGGLPDGSVARVFYRVSLPLEDLQ